jgi:ATP-binding cassette, subfamily B, bacterial
LNRFSNGTLNSWSCVSNLTARELLFLWREYVLPRWGFLVSLTVFTAFVVTAELLGPYLLQRTIDAATQGQAWLWFALGFLLVTVAALAARVVIGTVATRLAFATTNALRADVLRHVMGLGLAFRDRTPVGDTMQVLEGDIGSLSNVLSGLAGQVIVQALVVLGVIVVAFVLHPLAGSSVLSCVLFAWLVLRRSPAQNALLWREARETQAASNALTYSHLNARADLSLNRGTVYSLRGFAQARAAFLPAQRAAIASNQVRTFRANATFAFSVALAYGVGGLLHSWGEFSLGEVFMLTRLVGIMTWPLMMLSFHLEDFTQALSSVERIHRLRLTQPDLPEPSEPQTAPQNAPSLKLEDVRFSYGELIALQDVNLTVPARAVVGIIGPSGSGKTTLGQLLTRSRDPSAGRILLGDTDSGDIDLRDLSNDDRNRFVYRVDQDQSLIRGSLAHNLGMYAPLEPNVLERATDLLLTLHPPFAQWLHGDLPDSLSDGEVQLIALARAFVSTAKLIVLDEVNSRLDPEMRRVLSQTLLALAQEKTVFVIAHRQETLEVCSHLLVLEAGLVTAFGPRDAVQIAEVWL